MHKEILTKKQIALLPLIRSFSKNFGLVGGTAAALYIGHRRSIDFDLFTAQEFDNFAVRKTISRFSKISRVLTDQKGQYTMVIDNVKLTFFHYPFIINFSNKFNGIIKLPDLLTLSAMKAYALGRRAKWKDYVDLYFIIKSRHSIGDIVKKAKQIFGAEFNEKIFRSGLAYFDDINYSEKIIFMKGFRVSNSIIKKGLIDFSLR